MNQPSPATTPAVDAGFPFPPTTAAKPAAWRLKKRTWVVRANAATPHASSGTESQKVATMTNDGKQQTPGYKEENPKPHSGKDRVPGEGHPKEHQNMPDKKPGKQGS